MAQDVQHRLPSHQRCDELHASTPLAAHGLHAADTHAPPLPTLLTPPRCSLPPAAHSPTQAFMYLGCTSPSGDCDVAEEGSEDWGEDERWGRRSSSSSSRVATEAMVERDGAKMGREPFLQGSSRQGSGKPSGWAQLKVDLGAAATAAAWPVQASVQPSVMFGIGLTDAPSYRGVYSSSQCDRIWGAPAPNQSSLVCQGADPLHLVGLSTCADAFALLR